MAIATGLMLSQVVTLVCVQSPLTCVEAEVGKPAFCGKSCVLALRAIRVLAEGGGPEVGVGRPRLRIEIQLHALFTGVD